MIFKIWRTKEQRYRRAEDEKSRNAIVQKSHKLEGAIEAN